MTDDLNERPWPVSRLGALEGLRGLAALAVVSYHFGFRVTEIYPEVGAPLRFLVFGQYGVHLFFVISGFVIFLTLQRASPKAFVVGRFIRLYPIYWVCLGITVAIVAIFGLPSRDVSTQAAFTNVSMMQGFLGIPHVDGSYWTLTAELGFYAQVGLLFFGGLLQGRRLIPTLYVWLIATAAASQVPKFLSGGWLQETLSNLSLGLVWIPLFVSGVALYLLWTGDRRVAIFLLPVLSAAILAAKDLTLGLATVVVLSVVVAALWWDPPWTTLGFVGPLLATFGALSYPLYLIHQNVGYVGIRWLTGLGLPLALAAFAVLGGVVVLAALLTTFVDGPVRRRLKAWWLPRTQNEATQEMVPSSRQ